MLAKKPNVVENLYLPPTPNCNLGKKKKKKKKVAMHINLTNNFFFIW